MRVIENEQQVIPSIQELAAQVEMSTAYFSRLFASQLGESSSAYGRRIRLDHAVNRLRYDPASINEVAQDFGYTSHAAFTRAFSAQFGSSPREYMSDVATQTPNTRPPLPSAVTLIRRTPTLLAARRFFGNDILSWWRQFDQDLPPVLRNSVSFVGLSYDDPRVTPDQHRRYDCCAVIDSSDWDTSMATNGLDLISLPGGLHGQVTAEGSHNLLRSLVTSLFVDWLPTRSGLAPEGDPLPIFFQSMPIHEPVSGHVEIRVRERAGEQKFNAKALNGLQE